MSAIKMPMPHFQRTLRCKKCFGKMKPWQVAKFVPDQVAPLAQVRRGYVQCPECHRGVKADDGWLERLADKAPLSKHLEI